MTRWDWNQQPDSKKEWKAGDEVWVDNTLYEVDIITEPRVTLRRREPITIRRMPEDCKAYGASFVSRGDTDKENLL